MSNLGIPRSSRPLKVAADIGVAGVSLAVAARAGQTTSSRHKAWRIMRGSWFEANRERTGWVNGLKCRGSGEGDYAAAGESAAAGNGTSLGVRGFARRVNLRAHVGRWGARAAAANKGSSALSEHSTCQLRRASLSEHVMLHPA